jgi:TonB family protein
MWDPRSIRGNLLLAFAVELSGSVHQVTVLVSSGDKELDERAVESWRTARYRTPAKLDGRPVRALTYVRFKAIVNGR